MRKLDDINWQYRPAAKTNISETLRKYGFEPPSESAWYQEKWATYRNALALKEGSSTKTIDN